MANEIDGEEIIKEGMLELQHGSGAFRSFKRRYMIVKKSGAVDLYEKEEYKGNEKKKKESFQLQGGEEIIVAKVYQNRFRFKIMVDDHKKKNPQKWTFGFESETSQQQWLNVFQGVLKQLNALVNLTQLMTGSNSDTMEGQLKIAEALADCGQLSKARRIFTKLISKYGQESTEVHEQYENFLSFYCNDIHQAETNFLRRKKFFCLPKEFGMTEMGEQFKRISKRIEFMMTMKNTLISQSLYEKNNSKTQTKQDISIEYRNLENIWPNYLYEIPTKHLREARKLVKEFLRQTNRDVTYQFEYSYKDIEQLAWYIIKQCIDGKKGAVRLQARLEAVGDAEAQKKLKSKNFATKFDTPTPVWSPGSGDDNKENLGFPKIMPYNSTQSSKSEVFPSKEEYLASKKKKDTMELPKGMDFDRANSESVLGDDVMDEILGNIDDFDMDFDDDGGDGNNKKKGNKQKVESKNHLDARFTFGAKNKMNTMMRIDETVDEANALINDLDLDFGDDDYDDDDNTAALKKEMYKPLPDADKLRAQAKHPQGDKQRSTNLLHEELDGILDLKLDETNFDKLDVQQQKYFSNGIRSSSGGTDDMFGIFDTIHAVLGNIVHHIFPWTAFMLIWKTRRDEMKHIGDSNTHKEQLQCIQEFVYLFTRGCFQELDNNWDYALLLQTLYNISTDQDHEDVKYKMCLSGVRVIGDQKVTFMNKNAVSNFMKKHKWLSIVKGQNKVLAMRQYFLKGLRFEIQRIHDSLNTYYQLYVFEDKLYAHLNAICTKNNVGSEINTQTAEKCQGKSTWGPRNNDKYDSRAFELVCQHRQINPPKPKKNPGNFDEAYMLFCLSLAKKLNPYFQKQIKIATKSLNCKHFEADIKDKKRCYELMKHELSQFTPPKAARILDYCKCTVAFDNIVNLIRGYKALDDNFRVCKISNYFDKKLHNINNYKYMNVYILCKHPTVKFIRLICEVRLTLKRVQELHDERGLVKECYQQVLHPSEIKAIMKEVATGKVPKNKVHSPTNN